MQKSENVRPRTRGCVAQTYWYENGVQRAKFCQRDATMQVRSMDNSRNDLCDEHGALAIEAGATKVRDLTSPPEKA